MQVIIDEVVSHVRAVEGGTSLSPETIRTIVRAVMDAVEARERLRENRDEEHSTRNYQQRNQPWRR
jgi:hypothetical protein